MKKADLKTLALFFEELSFLLEAGVNILTAVNILNDTKNKPMLKITSLVVNGTQAGLDLGEVFEKHNKFFGKRYAAHINAGIQSGTLPQVLFRLAGTLQNQSKIRHQLRNAMIYPTLLLLLTISISLYLFLSVVPKMAEQMAEITGNELPAITQTAVSASQYIATHKLSIFLLALLVGIGCFFLIRTFQYQISKLATRIPVIGALIINLELSEYYLHLSNLLQSNVTLMDSLAVCSDSIQNRYMQKSLSETIAKYLFQGYIFGNILAQVSFVDSIDSQCIQIAEQSGKLPQMLLSISKRKTFYAEETTKTLIAMLQPILLLIMGSVIGIVALAIYLPMMNF